MTIRPTTYDLAMLGADYPLRDGPPLKSLILFSHMRSGSTMLGEILYYAGGLGCPLEYFHRGFQPGFVQRWKTDSADDYLKALHLLRTDPSGAFSTKLFWQDLVAIAQERQPDRFAGLEMRDADEIDDEVYRDIMAILNDMMPNPTFIFLSRIDFIRQAVSSVLAAQSGLWRDIPGQGPEIQETVRYDYDEIARAITVHRNCLRHWEHLFAANGVSPYRVEYEQLKADPERVTRELLSFLGHPFSPPVIRMQRQANPQSEDFVRRFLAELFETTNPSDPDGILQPQVD